MKKIITIISFIFLYAGNTFSSCPGMSGESAIRCNCHESSIGLPGEAFKCSKDSDCMAIEGDCADWAVLNSKYFKENKLVFKNKLPKLVLPKKPLVSCKESTCMPVHPVN